VVRQKAVASLKAFLVDGGWMENKKEANNKRKRNNRLTMAGLGNAASSNRIKSKVNDLWEGQRDWFCFRILWVQRNTAKKVGSTYHFLLQNVLQ
jgi:hypothetical protein